MGHVKRPTMSVGQLLDQLEYMLEHGHVCVDSPVGVIVGEMIGARIVRSDTVDGEAFRETVTYGRTHPVCGVGHIRRHDEPILVVVIHQRVETLAGAEDDDDDDET